MIIIIIEINYLYENYIKLIKKILKQRFSLT